MLIYQAKGLEPAQARALAERLLTNKDSALDTLVREELGIDPERAWWVGLGRRRARPSCSSPWARLFPVAPFLWLQWQ